MSISSQIQEAAFFDINPRLAKIDRILNSS